LIDSEVRAASVRGDEVALSITELARGVLYNGLSRYDRVMDIARWAKEEDELTLMHLVLPELLEAAVRTGDRATASSALDRLSSKTQAMGTEWALGGRGSLPRSFERTRGGREALPRRRVRSTASRSSTARRSAVLKAAEEGGRLHLSLGAIRELRGIVELLARITGELDERPVPRDGRRR
jgi:hypothetical protein